MPASRHAVAADVREADEAVAVARGLSTASICAVAASAATATTFAVNKFTKNLYRVVTIRNPFLPKFSAESNRIILPKPLDTN